MTTRTTVLSTILALSAFACAAPADEGSTAQPVGAEAPDGTQTPATAAPANAPEIPAAPPAATASTGGVFTLSNAVAENAVVAFERKADGMLAEAGSFKTGGKGTGAGLGSQGALALSPNGKFLLAVDAGSNEITSFSVDGAKLTLRAHVASHGTMPVSVAVRDDLVYVVHAGGINCIVGFRLGVDGSLTQIAGSQHALSVNEAGAAQISFNPTGDALVVTEKATNMIDVFKVNADGSASNGYAYPSSGKTPFGFAFSPDGHLIVTEAFMAAPGASASSSYKLKSRPSSDTNSAVEPLLLNISASIPTKQTAACWIAVTKDGKWGFTTNTPSGNISTFGIGTDGMIKLRGEGATAATGEGSRPIDLAMDRDSKFLYSLNAGTHNLAMFTVTADGALVASAMNVKVPDTAAGLTGN